MHITKLAQFTIAHIIKKHIVNSGATASRLPASPTSKQIIEVSIRARKGSPLCLT